MCVCFNKPKCASVSITTAQPPTQTLVQNGWWNVKRGTYHTFIKFFSFAFFKSFFFFNQTAQCYSCKDRTERLQEFLSTNLDCELKMSQTYRLGSSVKVEQLQEELSAQIQALRTEIEDNEMLQNISSKPYRYSSSE